jgi:hypothetical protein
MFPFMASAANENGGHPNATDLLMPRILLFQDSGIGFGVLMMEPPASMEFGSYTVKPVCALPFPGINWPDFYRRTGASRPLGKITRGKPWGRPIRSASPAAKPDPDPLPPMPRRKKRPSPGLIMIREEDR